MEENDVSGGKFEKGTRLRAYLVKTDAATSGGGRRVLAGTRSSSLTSPRATLSAKRMMPSEALRFPSFKEKRGSVPREFNSKNIISHIFDDFTASLQSIDSVFQYLHPSLQLLKNGRLLSDLAHFQSNERNEWQGSEDYKENRRPENIAENSESASSPISLSLRPREGSFSFSSFMLRKRSRKSQNRREDPIIIDDGDGDNGDALADVMNGNDRQEEDSCIYLSEEEFDTEELENPAHLKRPRTPSS